VHHQPRYLTRCSAARLTRFEQWPRLQQFARKLVGPRTFLHRQKCAFVGAYFHWGRAISIRRWRSGNGWTLAALPDGPADPLRAEDSRDRLAGMGLEHGAPRHQREIMGALDQGEPAAQEVEAAPVGA